MDIRMTGADGLTATATIRADPDLSTTRVLVLTTFETDEDVARSLRAGASGFRTPERHPQRGSGRRAPRPSAPMCTAP
jgi:CheY-like chemotaxis protein